MKYQVSFRAKTWYLHMWKYHVILHDKSRLSHQKTIEVKWFGILLVFI